MKIITKPEFYTKKFIKEMEAKYNGKYVCELCIKDKYDCWVNKASLIFYNENPQENHSQYFAITAFSKSYIISDASFLKDIKIAGVVDSKGNVIYSRYRHDYITSPDRTVSIDGGREYTRVRGTPKKYVTLIIKEGVLCTTN